MIFSSITLTTSAVSFAAIDFDNSNFSPNFSNLNISNNATIDGGLFIKTLNLITNKEGQSEIQVNGQVQFNDAIFGDNENLKISSDVSITGNLEATSISNVNIDGDISVDNLTVEDGIKPPAGSDTLNISQPDSIDSTFKLEVGGQIIGDSLKARGTNLPGSSIADITRLTNKLRNLGLSTSGSTYTVTSDFNSTVNSKAAYCDDNDIILNCSNIIGPGAHLYISFPVTGSTTQGCISTFTRSNDNRTSFNGVYALCLDLN